MSDALVIGAGPAGLMAAQELARAGRKVTVLDAKPSPARKFLMAGKSGLNLTRHEPFESFLANFTDSAAPLRPILENFDNAAVQDWARALGQELFTGSTGRVFPKSMKASPLLRAWLGQLTGQGVELRLRWRWQGWDGDRLLFQTPDGPTTLTPKTTVLALGGASWPRLGSDGAWAGWLAARGVHLDRFEPANAGLRVNWTPHMTRHFGTPVKSIRLCAGDSRSRGEIVISESGLEGGGIYGLSPALRQGKPLLLDLLPDRDETWIATRIAAARGKTTLANKLRKALGLRDAKLALLFEWGQITPDPASLARQIKTLPVAHQGPGPLDRAISTAGGIAWQSLDPGLMIRELPGTFAAGEMLSWEAPTGGYLISACLATGKWAGRHAARRG